MRPLPALLALVACASPEAGPPALVTALHARCVDARENCEFLREIGAPNAILVCPTGNTPCGIGMSTWAGDAKALAAEVEADTITPRLGATHIGPHRRRIAGAMPWLLGRADGAGCDDP